MFYYLAMYSFSVSKPVTGPFATRDEAWTTMKKNAENEQAESEALGLETATTFDEDSGEIIVTESSEIEDTSTTWILFEIEERSQA